MKNVKYFVRFATCVCLTAFSLGCAAQNGTELTSYTAADASYTIVIPHTSDKYPDFVGRCERIGTTTVIRMTSPERLTGLTVSYDSGSRVCSISAGEAVIPLSEEVASGLTGLLYLLERPAYDGGLLSKSADGTETVLSFDVGEVVIGDGGLPTRISDTSRTIYITDYTVK